MYLIVNFSKHMPCTCSFTFNFVFCRGISCITREMRSLLRVEYTFTNEKQPTFCYLCHVNPKFLCNIVNRKFNDYDCHEDEFSWITDNLESNIFFEIYVCVLKRISCYRGYFLQRKL